MLAGNDGLSRRAVLRMGAAGMLAMTGCGTILYPERRGQPAGRLDWGVVALDAIGLLFFLVPGVIAFAVDFATGAIYLPPGYYCYRADMASTPPLERVTVSRAELTRPHIERIASQRAGRDVRLDPGAYRTKELESIEQFWTAYDSLAAA